MKKSDFRTRLIEVRKAKGLTQKEVAEKCKITVRTIQRIESGKVKPRAFTIKLISETLGFDFFTSRNTEYDINSKNQRLKLVGYNILRYLKNPLNLKSNTMKKISILSMSLLAIVLIFSIFKTTAQTETNKSLIIELNEDQSIKRVKAAFTHNLTLDSLVQIKNDLENIGILLNYKMIEFDTQNMLLSIDCQVVCNDGFSGSFRTITTHNKDTKIGFYRDYSPNAKSPFGTGGLDYN